MDILMGAISEPLSVQIEKAGCKYCGDIKLEVLQDCANAISLLLIWGYLPPAQAHNARKRLIKDIVVNEKEPQ